MLTRHHFPSEPFTIPMAAALGIHPWQVHEALDQRIVRRVLRGAYVRADLRDDIETRVAAAALVISRHSVACDRTAAWLHGVDVFSHHELEILPPLETCVLRWKEPTRRADHRGCTRDLRSRDLVAIGSLRVTSPLRTALDLGCSLPQRDALAALDAFMRIHGLTREQMEREALRFRRRRGVRQLRRLLAIADPRAESMAESWIRFDLVHAGLPSPQLQVWVEVNGRPAYRLDLAYPLHKVAIEYDGAQFHDSPEARARDEERRTWLRDHGWIVIVVDRSQLGQRATEAWTAEVRQALTSRRRWAA